uniref:PWWP domain-containing protein n=1 Tax=Plectus sambesii TaxID=2011161 RepID=A0A914X345_9BILA
MKAKLIRRGKAKIKLDDSSEGAQRLSEYAVGDYVFTKIKGHPVWPSKIDSIETLSRNGKLVKKYGVFFFGTNETATVFADRLFLYTPNRERFGLPKSQNNFNSAMYELEMDLRRSCRKRRPVEEVEEVPESEDPWFVGGETSSLMEKVESIEDPLSTGQESSGASSSLETPHDLKQELAVAFAAKYALPATIDDYDRDVRLADYFYWTRANKPETCNRQTVVDSLRAIVKLEASIVRLMADAIDYQKLLALLEPTTRALFTARREPMLLRPSFLLLLMRLYRTELLATDSESLKDVKKKLKEVAGRLAYRFLTHAWRKTDDEEYPQPAPPSVMELLDQPDLWRQRMADACGQVLHRPENKRYLQSYEDVSLYLGPGTDEL